MRVNFCMEFYTTLCHQISPQYIWKLRTMTACSQTLQIWTRWASYMECWKSTTNSSQSSKWLIKLEVALQSTVGRAATETHQQGSGQFHKALDCLRGCQRWLLRTFALVTLFISKSASSSHHKHTGSYQTPTDTTLRTLRNGGLS